jgi:RES domain-containing protein
VAAFYRICRKQFAALDGEGARINGGRWNSPGVAVVYLATSISLAILEALVHADQADLPSDLVVLSVNVPDDIAVTTPKLRGLPSNWNTLIEPPECKAVGDAWIRAGKRALLRLPSAIVAEENIMLLNPAHPDARRVKTLSSRAFVFDARLW